MHKKIYYNKYNNQENQVNAPNLKYKKIEPIVISLDYMSIL